jgi:dienelactone hydrolase
MTFGSPHRNPLKLALCLALLATVSAVWLTKPWISLGLVATGFPKPNGPYPISSHDLQLALALPGGGEAPVAVHLWAPHTPAATAPPALILYAPVWGATRTDNTALTEALASHGFVVAAIDDIVHDAIVHDISPADTSLRRTKLDVADPIKIAQTYAAFHPRTALQARKISAVLNALLKQRQFLPPEARFDIKRIGMVGASFGGATAFEAARSDRRIRAAMNLDGWIGVGSDKQALQTPFANFNSTRGASAPGAATDPAATPSRAFFARISAETTVILERQLASRADMIDITIEGASHSDYNNELYDWDRWKQWRPWRHSMIAPTRLRAIVDAYATAFFDTHLNGTSNPILKQTPSPYPEVTIKLGAAPTP